jgi:hypothetical protein
LFNSIFYSVGKVPAEFLLQQNLDVVITKMELPLILLILQPGEQHYKRKVGIGLGMNQMIRFILTLKEVGSEMTSGILELKHFRFSGIKIIPMIRLILMVTMAKKRLHVSIVLPPMDFHNPET